MARILFSALSARRGGGLTYIRRVVGSFPPGDAHRLSVLSADPIAGLPELDNVEWLPAPRWTVRPIARFLFGAFYFRFLWPRRRNFDAVYFAGGSFDVALPDPVRRIVAFRNMLPFDDESRRRVPLGWQRLRLWLLRRVQSRAFRRADLVIFISEYARAVIDRIVPRRQGASVVISHGAGLTGAPLGTEIAARLPERFVLYLSILDAYKAQVELVEAWARMTREEPRPEKLVLAGPEDPLYAARVRAAIDQWGMGDEIILLGPVPHDQVSDLTRRAELNLFLSACENCPNILLELMCVGTPLLVSARQPMPELGGPDLDYVDPYDVEGLVSSLRRLLNDPDRRARIAAAALERSALFDWGRTGDRTWRAILDCAKAAGNEHPAARRTG
ncbi:MAG TPA: glycosyltransferase [Allosphingosinicella sp.]|jgi:glycosyltransferase involved in cell wall biosynthesis